MNNLDFSELSFDEIGIWPLQLRIIIIIIACALVAFGSYEFFISDNIQKIKSLTKEEIELRKEFKNKYHKAINLDAYKSQMTEMEERFAKILEQLPKEGQIPELLKDISQQAQASNLKPEKIELNSDVDTSFYKEIPIILEFTGTYHSLGAFATNISKLSRIVTLHDFSLNLTERQNVSLLSIKINAKTYWYNIKDGG